MFSAKPWIKILNYRKVSLTSVVGKLLVRILKDNIYINWKDWLFGYSQHCLVCGWTSLMNVIEFLDKITKKVDEGRVIDVVCMDQQGL